MKKIKASLLAIAFSAPLISADQQHTIDLPKLQHQIPSEGDDTRLPVKKEIELTKLIDYAYEITNEYLQPMGKTFTTLPANLQKKITHAIKKTYLFFEDKANYMGKKSVNRQTFKQEILVQLQSLISSSSELISSINLDIKIDECISDLCKAHSVDHRKIPQTMCSELLSRKEEIKKQALKLLIDEKRSDLSKQAIHSMVHEKLESFIERVQYALLWGWINVELETIARKHKQKKERTSHIPYSAKSNELKEKSRLIRLRKVTD